MPAATLDAGELIQRAALAPCAQIFTKDVKQLSCCAG
jgi:hypothetical protein